jgi:hypothetical protein
MVDDIRLIDGALFDRAAPAERLDAPVPSFVATLAERSARECLTSGGCREAPALAPVRPSRERGPR